MSALTTPRQTTAARLRPAAKAPAPKEQAIQAAIIETLRLVYPDVLVAHVANGGFLMDPRVMARLRWQGLLPGFPDLTLYWTGGHGLCEVKRPGGYLSDEQKAVHATLTAKGHQVAVVRSVDELHATLAAWGVPSRMRAA